MQVDKLLGVLYVVLIFLAGFFSAYLFGIYSGDLSITGNAIDLPSDYVSSGEIFVYPDEVVIKIEGAKVTNYDSTGSMLPILGKGANGISVKPSSPGDIVVGDIVSYWSGGNLIVHRVIEKGVDEEGVYFVLKGDSNGFSDGKVRFEAIEHKLVGLVY